MGNVLTFFTNWQVKLSLHERLIVGFHGQIEIAATTARLHNRLKRVPGVRLMVGTRRRELLFVPFPIVWTPGTG